VRTLPFFFFPFPIWQNGWLPSLSIAILPHPIHVLCLDFSIWSTKPRIFLSQTVPVPLTGRQLNSSKLLIIYDNNLI
jgi:hypothetical protein